MPDDILMDSRAYEVYFKPKQERQPLKKKSQQSSEINQRENLNIENHTVKEKLDYEKHPNKNHVNSLRIVLPICKKLLVP